MIMTPQEYIKQNVVAFPTLFKKSDLHHTKMAIYDQLLNVIGNGIDDSNIIDYLNPELITENLEEEFDIYMSEPLYTGHNEDFSIFESGILKRDFDKYSGVTTWKADKEAFSDKYSLYPNFQEQYSLIYDTEVFYSSKEWIKEIIWFYKMSLIEIESDNYKTSFPKNNVKENEFVVNSYTKTLANYDSNEAITKAYDLEFDGDVEKFITNRWIKDKKKIIKFIKNTLLKLEEEL